MLLRFLLPVILALNFLFNFVKARKDPDANCDYKCKFTCI